MRRVFGLGEALLDIIFKDNTPISAKPGGSVLNALVSLSRVNFRTYLISELGADAVGNIIATFLYENRINTNYIYRHRDGSTTLALAFLDDRNDAKYQFYKNNGEGHFLIEKPKFREEDIFLFGSTLAINPIFRAKVKEFIGIAHRRGATIIYDPNCRKDHTEDTETLQYIEENFSKSSIIRCSDEDLQYIYGSIGLEESILKVKHFCKNVVVTQNSKNVIFDFENIRREYPVAQIDPISTIGAGDNFNAGIIYALTKIASTKTNLSHISALQLDIIAKSGIDFSTEVCLSINNYISERLDPQN